MKIFTAIPVPQTVVAQIQEQIEILKDDYPSFNWVPPQNYIIDIYSIGSIQKEHLTQVIDGISDDLYDIDATRLYSFGLGMSITHQIVLYVTFQRNKQLETISDRVMSLFIDDAKVKKLKYEPRLNIARYKIPSKQQYFHLKTKLSKMDITIEFPVNEIHLYENITGRDNPVYKDLATIPLYKDEA